MAPPLGATYTPATGLRPNAPLFTPTTGFLPDAQPPNSRSSPNDRNNNSHSPPTTSSRERAAPAPRDAREDVNAVQARRAAAPLHSPSSPAPQRTMSSSSVMTPASSATSPRPSPAIHDPAVESMQYNSHHRRPLPRRASVAGVPSRGSSAASVGLGAGSSSHGGASTNPAAGGTGNGQGGLPRGRSFQKGRSTGFHANMTPQEAYALRRAKKKAAAEASGDTAAAVSGAADGEHHITGASALTDTLSMATPANKQADDRVGATGDALKQRQMRNAARAVAVRKRFGESAQSTGDAATAADQIQPDAAHDRALEWRPRVQKDVYAPTAGSPDKPGSSRKKKNSSRARIEPTAEHTAAEDTASPRTKDPWTTPRHTRADSTEGSSSLDGMLVPLGATPPSGSEQGAEDDDAEHTRVQGTERSAIGIELDTTPPPRSRRDDVRDGTAPQRQQPRHGGTGQQGSPAMSLVSAPSSAPDSPEQNSSAARKALSAESIAHGLSDDPRIPGDGHESRTADAQAHAPRLDEVSLPSAAPCAPVVDADVLASGACCGTKAGACDASRRAAETALGVGATVAPRAPVSAPVPSGSPMSPAIPESGKWCPDCAGVGLHIAALMTQLRDSAAEADEKEKEKEKKPSWKRTVSAAMLGTSSASTSSAELSKVKAERTRLEEENAVLRATVEYLYKKIESCAPLSTVSDK